MDPEEFRRQAKKGLIIAGFFGAAVLFYYLGWRTFLVVYLFVVAAIAMLAILMQRGRGGGLAGYLGGGGDSVLGVHSASPIARATYVMLALFVFIAMLIARHDALRGPTAGVLDAAPPGREAEAPAEEWPEAQRPAATSSQLPPAETPDTTPPGEAAQDD